VQIKNPSLYKWWIFIEISFAHHKRKMTLNKQLAAPKWTHPWRVRTTVKWLQRCQLYCIDHTGQCPLSWTMPLRCLMHSGTKYQICAGKTTSRDVSNNWSGIVPARLIELKLQSSTMCAIVSLSNSWHAVQPVLAWITNNTSPQLLLDKLMSSNLVSH